jgi:Ca-activated chloride channel family protein
MRHSAALGLLVSMGLVVGCGGEATLDRTMATVETVRGAARIGEDPIERVGRGGAGQEVSTEARGLSRLALDSGPQLLLDAQTNVALLDENTVRLTAGRAYVEVGEGEELSIEGPTGTLRARDASLSARIADGVLSAYVVRGEVSYTAGEHRGVVRAGEELALRSDGGQTTSVALWHDWTGGLARPGPGDASGPAGVGVLEARVPDETGQARWPLVIRRLDVRVRIEGDLALTEVEQVFFNPASETVEGLYRIRVPEEAVLQRFAVDRNGRLVDGYVREQQQARQAYEAQVYRGSTLDPALLEWVAPGRYQARIYPIQPGEARRIVVRYAEWLSPIGSNGPRIYRYPMGAGRRAPRVQELSIVVDVENAGHERIRAGMGAAIEQGRVRLRRSDFAPRSDFWLELEGGAQAQRAWQAAHEPPPRAPDAREVPHEADERDYWFLPLRLPERLAESARSQGSDLVIVADVSAGTDRAQLELGRSVVEAITAHLGEHDRVAIVSADLAIRALGEDAPRLGDTSPARIEALLDALARAPSGGATDLGEAIAGAAALLDSARPGAVIYVGDGAPTVGELEAEGLLARIARLPAPLRFYAVAVGSDSNLDLLEVLTRGGGLALRVEERSAAATAALSLLAHVGRPVAQRVTVELGTEIENVYPRRPVDVVIGDVLPVVGRVRGTPPTRVTVRGTVGGQGFEETVELTTVVSEEATDLRLRWAAERLRQLLLDGAGREEVAELGTRYGLITPYTSYYVPSAQELANMGVTALRWIERPSVLAEVRTRRTNPAEVLLALSPLGLTGCLSREDSEAPAEQVAPAVVAPPASSASPSFAIEGTGSDVPMAREQAAAEEVPGTTTATRLPAAPMPMEPPSPPGEVIDGWGNAAPDPGRFDAPAQPAAPPPPPMAAAAPIPTPSTPEPEPRRMARRPMGGSASADEDSRAGFDMDAIGAGGGGSAGPRVNVDDLLDALPGFRGALGTEGERTGAVAMNRDRASLVVVDTAVHGRTRCSDAADLPLADRSALWTERLQQAGGPSGWVDVYRRAVRDCEAPTWRDRRALLGLALGQAGTVDRMIDLYRLLDSGAARGFLRSAILRRVRSPEDLRTVRNAFGLGAEPDWALVEQILARAPDADGRVRALRRLVAQYPDSFDLKLRLLELLETTGRAEEARRLAHALRTDPRSDAGVRTAVGELYLRMGREDDARRAFSEIVEHAPLDELARRRLGDLYRAHGWFEDAYRQYQTLASIRPDDPSVLLLLAQAAAGCGRVDEALRLEQRLMETGQPGAERGVARIAQLWSSVRLAKLRAQAREAGDEARLGTLEQRLRRSGVLMGAGELRVTLVWSHPDAQIALYAGHPGAGLARPSELSPEHGIEAFEVAEQERGAYRLEVRRADASSPTAMDAELVVVWHEGQADEVVRVIPLRFADGRASYAWTLDGNELRESR